MTTVKFDDYTGKIDLAGLATIDPKLKFYKNKIGNLALRTTSVWSKFVMWVFSYSLLSNTESKNILSRALVKIKNKGELAYTIYSQVYIQYMNIVKLDPTLPTPFEAPDRDFIPDGVIIEDLGLPNEAAAALANEAATEAALLAKIGT